MFGENRKGINILSIVTLSFMFLTIYADEAVITEENRNNNNFNNDQISTSSSYHPKFKRAWNQLQNGGWGKRNFDETQEDDSNDQSNRRLMKLFDMYGNKQFYDDIDDENNVVSKRAWSQFNNGWGKRDWNQLRGTF